MAKFVVSYEYAVSDRVTIAKGDVFKARGGPYYVSTDSLGRKTRVSMAARGPFVFVRLVDSGRRRWIEAVSTKDGTAAVLALTRRRSILPGSLVPRPYVVVGKARGKAPQTPQGGRAGRRGSRRRPPAGGPAAGRVSPANLAPPENPICPIDTAGQ